MIHLLIGLLLALTTSPAESATGLTSERSTFDADLHITTDTIQFRDIRDFYTIVRYWDHGRLLQLDIDRLEMGVDLDFILWDADKEPGLDAIRYYDDEQRKYITMSLTDPIDEEAIVDFHVQIEEVWFPGYYDSSGAIPIKLKPLEAVKRQPIWNK